MLVVSTALPGHHHQTQGLVWEVFAGQESSSARLGTTAPSEDQSAKDRQKTESTGAVHLLISNNLSVNVKCDAGR